MDCISCTDDGAFNRVLVNRLTGEELGLYCADCEAETFGAVLDDTTWHQENGCSFCDGAGKYLLPQLDCLIEGDDGDARLVEYMTIDEDVSLCAGHVDRLLPDGVRVEATDAEDRDALHPIEA